MIKKFIFTLIAMSTVNTVFANDTYSIYLVRHAEKQTESDNPSLTICGKARAKQLASMLSQTGISQIYSTSYQRTRQTATPLSLTLNVAVQNYNPKYLEQLAVQLQQRQANTLVVGHSNTTPQLASLLAKQKIPPLTEKDYQQLYQIQFVGEKSTVTIFKQPLTCS